MKTAFKAFSEKITAIFTAALCLVSLVSFASCGDARREPALKINSTSISDDVFVYFLDKAASELGVDAAYENVLERALKFAQTYYKTNSLAHKEGVSLSTAKKAAVSEKVNGYWSVFGTYYEKIGVTKETLTKVFTADSYRDSLLLFYYDKGGSKEISTAQLYANFRTNYIVFQVINGYFTYLDDSGATQRLSQNDIEALVLKFQNMESMINAGEKDMDDAAEFLAASGYKSNVARVVLKKGDTSYPAGFFEKVQDSDADVASVIGTTDYIFLVVREDAPVYSDYYNDKKSEILKDLVGDGIDTIIDESLTTETELVNANSRGFYLAIQQEKGGETNG